MVFAACGPSNAPPTRTITLFAAASTAKAMDAEITEFEARNPGITVHGDYEGTQLLLTKLQADPASADVFLSADRRHMDDAMQHGLVVDPRVLASNRLVVALPPGNPGHITSLADLARPGVTVDLADPSVPAGSYALQALQSIEMHGDGPPGFAKAVQANVVSRESDVEQVVAKVAAGTVDAGIVYATDARSDHRIGALGIPAAEQPATVYLVAATSKSPEAAAARTFVDFLFSTEGQHVLRTLGFLAPP